jgi:hypothetical protein
VASAADRGAGAAGETREAQLDRNEFPRRRFNHGRAASKLVLDQPGFLQLPKRLADRRARDPEFLGQAQFFKTIAGLEGPRHDLFFDAVAERGCFLRASVHVMSTIGLFMYARD